MKTRPRILFASTGSETVGRSWSPNVFLFLLRKEPVITFSCSKNRRENGNEVAQLMLFKAENKLQKQVSWINKRNSNPNVKTTG
jgi:hypothetical protein